MLWADLERVDTRQYSVFFLVPENCQSKHGFRPWPKQPVWGRMHPRAEKTRPCAETAIYQF